MDNQYNFEESETVAVCIHCQGQYLALSKFHLEKKPKKVRGHYVIPLEEIEVRVYDSPPPSICEACKVLPRCKDCGIIMCTQADHYHSAASKEKPTVCQRCYDFSTGDTWSRK